MLTYELTVVERTDFSMYTDVRVYCFVGDQKHDGRPVQHFQCLKGSLWKQATFGGKSPSLAVSTEAPAPGEETCWNARLFDITSKIKVLTNICSKCTVFMLAERSRQTSMTKNFLSTVLIALNLIVRSSGHQWAGRPQMVRILAFSTSSLLPRCWYLYTGKPFVV